MTHLDDREVRRDDPVVVKKDQGPSVWLWLLLAAAAIVAAILLYIWLADDDEDTNVETVPEDGVETVVEDGAFAPRLDEFEIAGVRVMVA